jgi:hypothetical protein
MAEIRATMAKHGLPVDDQPASTSDSKPAKPAGKDAADTTADNSPARADSAPALSDADSRLLQAIGVDADDLPADPARRDKVLGRYRDIAAANARLASENGRLKKTQPAGDSRTTATQQAEDSPQADGGDEEFDQLLSMLDDNAAPKFRKAVERIIARQTNQAPREIVEAQIHELEMTHFERGLAKVTFPDGIHKTDEKIREKLMDAAKEQFRAEAANRAAQGLPPVDLKKFNLAHAVERAVPIVFAEQFQAQAKKATTERRNTQIAGLPDAGVRSPTTRARIDPEEADLEEVRAVMKKHGLPVGV